MKTILAVLALSLVLAVANAAIGPFAQLGTGHYAGKLASYAQGETLATVIYENPGSDPASPGWIVFRKSLDGGETWTPHPVAQASNCLTQPTLYYDPLEIIVCYTKDSELWLSLSTDGGETWTAQRAGRTWENSPYTERLAGELKLFALDLPYPEYAQGDFCLPGDLERLVAPHLFTVDEISTNDTPVYYFGQDVIDGIVRSNGDIWIKQAGGGDNNGWPTFTEPVILSGEVQSFSGPVPGSEVFQGGLIENAPPAANLDASAIRWWSNLVGPPDYDPDRIMMVTVNGPNYTAYIGQLSEPVARTAEVYATYPYLGGEGEYLYTNNFTTRDTIWTIYGNGVCQDQALFVNSKLWIKGTFSGEQIWAAADTIFILDDILLSGTPAGEDPSTNTTDYVSLISEKSILIKYGYRDPADSLRYHGMCSQDQVPNQVYASLYALGNGFGNGRQDGVFSFEYQHPHPSLPAVHATIDGTPQLLTDIDLHRYRFPQTNALPWAKCNGTTSLETRIDYPWYNPLWPERIAYLERGVLSVRGNVNQRRRGYLHRGVVDGDYPNIHYIWNQLLDFCGGSSAPNLINHSDPVLGFNLSNVNFPGANGDGVGYKKSYHNDTRLSLDRPGVGQPWDRRGLWQHGLRLCSWDPADSSFAGYYLKQQLKRTRAKCFDRQGDGALYSVNDLLLHEQGDTVTDWSQRTAGNGLIRGLELGLDGSALIYQHVPGQNLARIRAYDSGGNHVQYEFSVPTPLNAIADVFAVGKLFARYVNGQIELWRLLPGGGTELAEIWPLTGIDPSQYDLAASKLDLVPGGGLMAEVYLWLHQASDANLPGPLWHARALLEEVGASDPVTPAPPATRLSAWPNPASGLVTVKVETASSQASTVEVYNLKGQRINSLKLPAGSGEIDWNGRDDQGRRVSPGIYFLKLRAGDGTSALKRICRI